MSRWGWINLALAIYCGALLLVLLQPAAVDTPGMTLTALDPAAIQLIRIERHDRLELVFERRADAWHMTHPRSAPAAARRVGQLLAVASAPLQPITAGADAAARYGLQPPQAVLHLDALQVEFGALDPSQRLRYVRSHGQTGAIDDLYYNLLQLPATHFIDREAER